MIKSAISTALFLLFTLCQVFAQTTIIPFGATWKYLDNGTNQGTAWRSASFNDNSWKAGPGKFGYGISDATTVISFGSNAKKKYITTYFRNLFVIDDASVYDNFTASVKRDDGVVVYVNGVEVFRNNMPAGTISHTTLASEASDHGTVAQTFSIPASAFHRGENLIAVEVHQAKANTPDMAFDLELTGNIAPPANQPPTVSLNSPAEGAAFDLGQAITISAIASDPEGELSGVEFFANGVSVGKDKTSPYTITWSPATAGTYTLAAKATDAAGASAISATVTIAVNDPTPSDQTPPTVLSINRLHPATETTSATSVTFRVTFSEQVTGVDATDFSTTTTGAVKGSVTAAVASGNAGTDYDVTISSISGEGTLRLDLNSSGTDIADLAGNLISGGYTNGQPYTIKQQVVQPGFASLAKLTPLSITSDTGEKPQSKVWSHAGSFWTVLPNATGTYLWRLDGTKWTSVLRLSSGTNTKSDCKVSGNVVHILLYQGVSSQMVSVEYVPADHAYQLWEKRPSPVSISLDRGVETATIDIDGTGRMWLASAGVSDVFVRWSDSPYQSWSAPIRIASGIIDDDIAVVTALPGKVGILWSNQNTKRFGFRTHVDGTDPTVWSADEVPASQSALNIGAGMADDHLNVAVASDGTLYCAVKTSYDTKGYTQIGLLVRRPSGNWDNLYEVALVGTRPVVILNEALARVRVVYTSADGGGNILYRESSITNISFGSALTLISGFYNNVTSTKHNFDFETVILASGGSEAVGVLATDTNSLFVSGTSQGLSSVGNTPGAIDLDQELYAYPNPFTSAAKVSFSLSAGEDYSVMLYDARGARLNTLKQGRAAAGGVNTIDIDGTSLPGGLYFVRLQTTARTRMLKLILDK